MTKITQTELQAIQRKLSKLLALTASPNEMEAASAMEKCTELMEKYGIASIDIDPVRRTVDTDSRFVQSHSKRKRMPVWMGLLASGLSEVFDCLVVSNNTNRMWEGLTFIGGASDVAILSDLFMRLKRVIGAMGRQYIEDYSGIAHLTPKSKETYCTGVVTTVTKRMSAIRRPIGTDLVLLRKDQIKKHMDNQFGKLKKATYSMGPSDSTDFLALHRGIEDGKNISLNKSVNGDTKGNNSIDNR